MATLSEHSEFFVSTEKCRRLAIGYCVAILPNILIIRINLYCKIRICDNEQSYENKKRKKGKKSFSCTESPSPLYIFHSFFYSHYPPQYLFHVTLRLVCYVYVSILAVIVTVSPFITFHTSFSIFSIILSHLFASNSSHPTTTQQVWTE